jgi:hypothetical protein
MDQFWNTNRNSIMIKYKIVEVNQAEHSIVVRYYTEKITETMLATDTLDGVIRRCRTDYSMDLPIPAPEGAELEQFIMLRAPADWLASMEKMNDTASPVSMDALVALIGVEKSQEPLVVTSIAPPQNEAALTLKIKEVVTELLQGNI